ncbi:TPA: hypothetical protein ACTUO9_002044 [Legionella anisa]
MSQEEFGGKTYYPDIGSVLINIRKLNYSIYSSSQEEKRKIIIDGEGVVLCNGLEIIDNGYKNNIIFVRIASWSEKKTNEFSSSHSQIMEAKSQQWSSFAGLYYYEVTPLELDHIVYQDDAIEEINSTSKIYLDLYLDDHDIKLIVQNYNDKNICGFTIMVNFINLLKDTPLSDPDGTKFIPPKENKKFFNSIGVLEGLSFSFYPKYFDYIEVHHHCSNPVVNKKSSKYYIENNNHTLFNKLDKNISILKIHSDLITEMLYQFKRIEKLLITIAIILIVFFIYKLF